MHLSELHDYQWAGVEFALREKKCALFMGLGLGKTAVALTAAAIEFYTGSVQRILVIAPLRVANTVWHNEASEWSHLSSLTFSIATGSAAERLAALRSDADVHVINVDNVSWLVKNFPRSKWRWDLVILDESSSFRNPSAKRTVNLRKATVDKIVTVKRVKKLRRAKVERLYLLSATPATNGLQGLWAQMSLIDNGKRLGKSFSAYLKTYFFAPPGADRRAKLELHVGAKERIYDRVRDRSFVLRTEDYMTLPPITYNDIVVEMPHGVRQQYKELEREFLLELPDEEEIIATNEGALCNKLLQFANGAVYTGETPERRVAARDYAVVHEAKIEAMKEIVEAAEGSENLLIAYYYQSDLKRLKAAFPHAIVMDKKGECVAPFNAGHIPLLLAHPDSAGMGLNLQRGASTIVFFSLLWNLESYQQFVGRLYRQGQTQGVTVNHVVCSNTIERRIAKRLRDNACTQQDFIDSLARLPIPTTRREAA